MSDDKYIELDKEVTTFGDWIEFGIEAGFVTEPFCHTHDGDPYMSEEESKDWEDGGDPCMPVLKVLV
jgi:hypothetical protein